jgi:ATP-dependent DNA ligase
MRDVFDRGYDCHASRRSELEQGARPPFAKGSMKKATPTPLRHRRNGSSPRLTRLIDEAPAGEHWLHEIKYDGYRMHARLEDARIQLLTVARAGRLVIFS